MFVFSHEFGLAVATSQHRVGLLRWLDQERLSEDLADFAGEIEADAFAIVPSPSFAHGAPLPVHLMASAVPQRLNGRLPRSFVFGSANYC